MDMPSFALALSTALSSSLGAKLAVSVKIISSARQLLNKSLTE
jgi:hypothetical protein